METQAVLDRSRLELAMEDSFLFGRTTAPYRVT